MCVTCYSTLVEEQESILMENRVDEVIIYFRSETLGLIMKRILVFVKQIVLTRNMMHQI